MMLAQLLATLAAVAAGANTTTPADGAVAVIVDSGPESQRAQADRDWKHRPSIASVTLREGYPRVVDRREIPELKPGYFARLAGICATRAEARAVIDRLKREGFVAYPKPTRSTERACPALQAAWDLNWQLFAAASKGSLRQVRTLIAAGADVNVVIQGQSALGAAAYRGERAMVKALLDAKARPDTRGAGPQDETPLILAARSDAHYADAVARLLIDAGADVNATTEGAEADYGTSPMTEALTHCRPAMVRLLWEKGARVVIEDSRRRCGTPDFPAPPELRELLAGTRFRPR